MMKHDTVTFSYEKLTNQAIAALTFSKHSPRQQYKNFLSLFLNRAILKTQHIMFSYSDVVCFKRCLFQVLSVESMF